MLACVAGEASARAGQPVAGRAQRVIRAPAPPGMSFPCLHAPASSQMVPWTSSPWNRPTWAALRSSVIAVAPCCSAAAKTLASPWSRPAEPTRLRQVSYRRIPAIESKSSMSSHS